MAREDFELSAQNLEIVIRGHNEHALAGELRLISRGTSEGFYRKLGFVEMPWEDVDLEAAEEDCDNCPYRAECHPVPMRLA
mgnify:CR=1 FL=1